MMDGVRGQIIAPGSDSHYIAKIIRFNHFYGQNQAPNMQTVFTNICEIKKGSLSGAQRIPAWNCNTNCGTAPEISSFLNILVSCPLYYENMEVFGNNSN